MVKTVVQEDYKKLYKNYLGNLINYCRKSENEHEEDYYRINSDKLYSLINNTLISYSKTKANKDFFDRQQVDLVNNIIKHEIEELTLSKLDSEEVDENKIIEDYRKNIFLINGTFRDQNINDTLLRSNLVIEAVSDEKRVVSLIYLRYINQCLQVK